MKNRLYQEAVELYDNYVNMLDTKIVQCVCYCAIYNGANKSNTSDIVVDIKQTGESIMGCTIITLERYNPKKDTLKIWKSGSYATLTELSIGVKLEMLRLLNKLYDGYVDKTYKVQELPKPVNGVYH